jgi:hypothetical protein
VPGNKDLNIIIGNLKGLFIVAAALMAAMAVISLVLGEYRDSIGFIIGCRSLARGLSMNQMSPCPLALLKAASSFLT